MMAEECYEEVEPKKRIYYYLEMMLTRGVFGHFVVYEVKSWADDDPAGNNCGLWLMETGGCGRRGINLEAFESPVLDRYS
jgi:hypothetical protein